MSGPIGSSQWMYSSAAGFYSYSIDQSLRLQNGVTQNLTVSSAFPTATDRKKVTISFWYKRSLNSPHAEHVFYGGGSGLMIRFNTNGTTTLYDFGAGSGGWQVYSATSDRLHRDPSAFYHFALILDSTQATASDRVKFYINGELWSLSTWSVGAGASRYPNLNASFNWHTGSTAKVLTTGVSSLNGYVAEFMSIDGQDVTIDDLGETVNGVWVAKEYTGSFGNAGFHLDFADSSAVGNDVSGNNVDFTADSGFAAHDVVLDSPSGNNFATLNPLAYSAIGTLSEGNLKLSTTTNNRGIHGTMALPSTGKWYYEVHVDSYSSGGGIYLGWATDVSLGSGQYSASKGIYFSTYNEQVLLDGSGQSGGYGSNGTDVASNGDIYSILLDVDNGKFYYAKNGTYFNSADPANGAGGLDVSATLAAANTLVAPSLTRGGSYNETYSINFGQDSKDVSSANADDNGIGTFEYAPPSGFLALCSANLPEPTISPNAAEQADDYFNTVLWSGNSTNNRSITTDHATDFVWIKKRGTTVQSHVLADSVRGTSDSGGTGNVGILSSNLTDAESTNSSDSGIASFDSTGFTIGAGSNTANADAPYQGTNASGHTYVGWSWKAGGTAVSNTDGSITSQVSAAPDAGFSITGYQGTGSAGATVGHALGVLPELLIIRRRDPAEAWAVWVGGGGFSNTQYLRLNATNAVDTATTLFNSTTPTSSVVTLGSGDFVNTNTKNYIMYAFASVEGYSKVGSYVGNGNADGTFVYTGFRPAFILTKRTNAVGGWVILDSERDSYNVSGNILQTESSAAELSVASYPTLDILSNGFKARSSSIQNVSGGTYIYLAFAEAPFKYANAR